jgi:hypothetical protein
MFAQFLSSVSLGQLLIYVVVIAACVALAVIAIRQFGISIPSWVAQVFWVVVVAAVVIVAIRFVLAL